MKHVIDAVQQYAYPLQNSEDLTPLLDAIGDARIVLLGEASHGTSEFYTTRAELSKRLIEEKGFNLIAVEGDWPASQRVNKFIKGYDKHSKSARQVLQAFERWPTWMWANEEIEQLVDWLQRFNQKNDQKKVGFYGIDVYSLWESLEEVISFLRRTDPSGIELEYAKRALSCFEPFNRHPETYAFSSLNITEACVDEVVKLLKTIRAHENNFTAEEESDLNVKINALVARNAEEYYRKMVSSDEHSWNIRDEHMVEMINEVMDYHGKDAKIIVWEHNSHIGDASATDMGPAGMINVGQILRQQNKKEDVFAIGFGTYEGTVIASEEWGAPFKTMTVPPAKENSWEDILHRAGAADKLLIFRPENHLIFSDWIGHRAIGVVYRPDVEAFRNYVPSKISDRYDSFIYLDKTKALSPIKA